MLICITYLINSLGVNICLNAVFLFTLGQNENDQRGIKRWKFPWINKMMEKNLLYSNASSVLFYHAFVFQLMYLNVYLFLFSFIYTVNRFRSLCPIYYSATDGFFVIYCHRLRSSMAQADYSKRPMLKLKWTFVSFFSLLRTSWAFTPFKLHPNIASDVYTKECDTFTYKTSVKPNGNATTKTSAWICKIWTTKERRKKNINGGIQLHCLNFI